MIATNPQQIGSAWDLSASPDRVMPAHLAEWVTGSACHPALAAANLQSLAGADVLQALAGDRLEQLGGWSQQLVTASVRSLLRPLEPVAEGGGWWCSGLDPLADWAPMAWGQFKSEAPRCGPDGKPVKYEGPWGPPSRSIWLRVPASVALLVARRWHLPLPAAVAADADGSVGAFWRWWASEPLLPLLVAEGSKKAGALLSIGVPALALPGIDSGAKRNGPRGADGRRTGPLELIPDLAGVPLKRRPVWVLFDHSSKAEPREPLAAIALGRLLAKRGAEVRTGTVPGTHGKGADDHLANGGTWEQLAEALQPLPIEPVIPRQCPAAVIAPAGTYLADGVTIPPPAVAPLVILSAPMGAGKTQAVASHLAPLAAAGVPVLEPSHRKAIGQTQAESIGVPWRPVPGNDERLQGMAACWDSWRPSSALQVSPTGWTGAVMHLGEWAQAVEHLLLSSGTTLADYRAEVLRTTAEQLPRTLQTIADESFMPAWAVELLEHLTGRRAYVIASAARPMAGRPLHAPEGFKTPQAAGDAFKARWAELVAAGEPFLCWTSSQRGEFANSAQQLAALHRLRCPGALIDVIDSTTRELAAEVATDPDGWAERRAAEAQRLGVPWAVYCTPAISSGLSWARWRPAAVLAYAGGRVAPEHVAQALARIRCPEVPAYLYAPERCPGGALKVGSGATNPAQLLADLRAVANPLYGQLEGAGAEGAWLQAWAELGAQRNRQHHAYRATIAGLLEREGWELQGPGPEPCTAAGAQAVADLRALALAYRQAADEAVMEARSLSPLEAAELGKRRWLEPDDQAALDRFRLVERWGLGGRSPSPALLDAERDGLRDRLRLGWLLTTPEALALVPAHDQARIAALDPAGRPFEPDRLRVAIGQQVAALQALGIPQLLERFAAGEVIAANDPAVVALHANATACRGQLTQAVGVSPGKLATGTLRALLRTIGWSLEAVGRIKTRGADRDAYTYRAQPLVLPEGVEAEALQAVWRAELEAPTRGAKSCPTGINHRGEKSPSWPPPPPPMPIWRHLLAHVPAIPWPSTPRPAHSDHLAAA